MDTVDKITQYIEGKKNLLCDVNDAIWDFSETKFEEYQSVSLLCKVLAEEGFNVTENVADMKTAFSASYGKGKPHIGLLAEYDALEGMSQVAGIAEESQLDPGGKGHGCGHHALGTAALAAAIAVKEFIKEKNIEGTVTFFGCPAEEGGSGKAYMARAGCFKDVDAALTWHPGDSNCVLSAGFLSSMQVCFKFHGTSSHAAASPHLGRSALDAVELTNIGSNYLREHIIQDARVHYAIVNSGGDSPNIVQSEAAVVYLIRAPKSSQAKDIYERVANIARGAALMTDTKLEIEFQGGTSEVIQNHVLESLLYEKFKLVGPASVDSDDINFAKKIRKSFENGNGGVPQFPMIRGKEKDDLVRSLLDKEIVDILLPYRPSDFIIPASTDVGDVSWNTPTSQISTTCYAKGTTPHSWQAVAQGKSALCHKGVLQCGKVLAAAALELMEDPGMLGKARQEWEKRLQGETYECPIP